MRTKRLCLVIALFAFLLGARIASTVLIEPRGGAATASSSVRGDFAMAPAFGDDRD